MELEPEPDLHELLRTLRVWAPEVTALPAFAPETAPAEPLPLFTTWFAQAVAAGQPEPHTMSLATSDAEGRPDVRTVMLHGADADGWSFASHSGSRKGRTGGAAVCGTPFLLARAGPPDPAARPRRGRSLPRGTGGPARPLDGGTGRRADRPPE